MFGMVSEPEWYEACRKPKIKSLFTALLYVERKVKVVAVIFGASGRKARLLDSRKKVLTRWV